MGQQELQGLQRSELERGIRNRQSISALFANGGKPTEAEIMGIDYESGLKFGDAARKRALDDENLRKARAETVEKTMKLYRDNLDAVTTPEQAVAWVTAQHRDEVLGPTMEKIKPLSAAIQSIQEASASPGGLAEWKNKNALGMTEFIKQNKPSIQKEDTGSTTNVLSIPGLGGAPSVLRSTAKTATPGDLLDHNDRVVSQGIARAGQGKPTWDANSNSWVYPPDASQAAAPAAPAQPNTLGAITGATPQPQPVAPAPAAPRVVRVEGLPPSPAMQTNAHRIREEQTKALKPLDDVQQEVTKMKQLLATPGAASAQQIQQSLTSLFDKDRPYNSLLNMNKNFGNLAQRVSGMVSRLATGDYTEPQRLEILQMVKDMENNVIKPTRGRIIKDHAGIAKAQGIPSDMVPAPSGYADGGTWTDL